MDMASHSWRMCSFALCLQSDSDDDSQESDGQLQRQLWLQDPRVRSCVRLRRHHLFQPLSGWMQHRGQRQHRGGCRRRHAAHKITFNMKKKMEKKKQNNNTDLIISENLACVAQQESTYRATLNSSSSTHGQFRRLNTFPRH